MSTNAARTENGLKWYQGLDRYCWVVLVIAALGWLFDTMDQNLFNLVRSPSLANLTRPRIAAVAGEKFRMDAKDLRQPGPLALKLRGSDAGDEADPAARAAAYIGGQLSPETQAALRELEAGGATPPAISADLKERLQQDLQRLIDGPPLHNATAFAGMKLRKETEALLASGDSMRANRLLIEDAFPGEIAKALDKEVAEKGGWLTAIFLIGWSVGGFVFGIIGDKIGRTGTMVLTILIYAIFTGLSGAPFVQSWEMYGFMRFMTAVGVGGEWAAGASLVAEVFPERARPMALGVLQALSAVGNMSAALITRGVSEAPGGLEDNWRWVYLVGALPALLVLWIRKSVKEPEKWHEAKSVGQELGNIAELWKDPTLRRNTIAATLMAAAGVGALWGVGFFSPDLLRGELLGAGMPSKEVGKKMSDMFLVQNLGAFFGIYLFAAFSEKTNRRIAFGLWFLLAWGSILLFFWGVQGAGQDAAWRAMVLAPILGFCALGPFSGYTVYFPELFPTRLRATGCGFCYNVARILAAGAPFALGTLSAMLGGYAQAASVVTCIYVLGLIGTWMGPETKGKPLPQ